MDAPELLTAEEERNSFDVTLDDAGLFLFDEPDLEAAEKEMVQSVQESLKDWAGDTGNLDNLYPQFSELYSTCAARIQQTDDLIFKYGELSAEISLGYIEQSVALWHQMKRLTERDGHNDE